MWDDRQLSAIEPDMAERLATVAERIAESFERSAVRHHADGKKVLADWERDVVAIERYNAARLRSDERPFGLRQIPPKPFDT